KVDNLEADWFYISSLAGSMETLEALVSYAAENHIKVAFNPGKDELAQPAKLKGLLDDIEVLQCNKEEMAQIVEGSTPEELAQHAAHYVPFAVVTDGPKGVAAVGEGKLVVGGMYEDAPVVDRLGAGDAFCSGVIAYLAQGRSLEDAIVFGSANSTSVVGHIGAKTGILKRDTELHDMPLKVTPFR
ncbi:MAG TPA: carbohydrate kinase family protein, partial [Candidatus Saccharimonadales bacterium]|nr:carbohydrate kinase family protein [Candidatus Saccharimonadales bacterium]